MLCPQSTSSTLVIPFCLHQKAILKYHSVPADYSGHSAQALHPLDMDGTSPSEAEREAEVMRAAFVENRDDKYLLNSNKDLVVQDSNGVNVMYEAAFEDMKVPALGFTLCKHQQHAAAQQKGKSIEADGLQCGIRLCKCTIIFVVM